MAERDPQNGWLETARDWFKWTFYDEIYGFFRKRAERLTMGEIIAAAIIVYAYLRHHPALLLLGVGAVVAFTSMIVSSWLCPRSPRVDRLADPVAANSLEKKLAELERQLAQVAAREYPPLPQDRMNQLSEGLIKLPRKIVDRDNRHIDIRRDEFADCIDLADAVASAFRAAGWQMMYLPRRGEGDELLPAGISVVAPPDDPRAPLIVTTLGSVLGPDYGPITLRTKSAVAYGLPSFLDGIVVIQIAIGQKPRRSLGAV
jgi:hypothetical protein